MANLENNNIKVGGYLIAKTITLGKTSTGNEYISARLTLQVGENDGERVDLEAFANKLTSSGQPNKIYQNLMNYKIKIFYLLHFQHAFVLIVILFIIVLIHY